MKDKFREAQRALHSVAQGGGSADLRKWMTENPESMVFKGFGNPPKMT